MRALTKTQKAYFIKLMENNRDFICHFVTHDKDRKKIKFNMNELIRAVKEVLE